MTVDRTVPHHTLSPHGLLRTTLIWFSVHVSEQCTTAYITGDSLSVASRLLTTLFCITHQAHTDYWEAHECGFGACEWIMCNCVHYIRQSVDCIMIVDCTVLYHARSPHGLLRTTLMGFSVHVSEQCATVYITDDSLSVASRLLTALFRITIVDCPVPHHAPSPHKLLRNTLMRFSVHVSE